MKESNKGELCCISQIQRRQCGSLNKADGFWCSWCHRIDAHSRDAVVTTADQPVIRTAAMQLDFVSRDEVGEEGQIRAAKAWRAIVVEASLGISQQEEVIAAPAGEPIERAAAAKGGADRHTADEFSGVGAGDDVTAVGDIPHAGFFECDAEGASHLLGASRIAIEAQLQRFIGIDETIGGDGFAEAGAAIQADQARAVEEAVAEVRRCDALPAELPEELGAGSHIGGCDANVQNAALVHHVRALAEGVGGGSRDVIVQEASRGAGGTFDQGSADGSG